MKKFALGVFLLLLPAAAGAAGLDENILAKDVEAIPKMTVQQLKEKVDKGDRIAIVDSRTGNSWDHSPVKIKGAIRVMFKDAAQEAPDEIPMGSEIVVYCT